MKPSNKWKFSLFLCITNILCVPLNLYSYSRYPHWYLIALTIYCAIMTAWMYINAKYQYITRYQ